MLREMIYDDREAFASLKNPDAAKALFRLPTPCYVIDEKRLEYNLKILSGVMKASGVKILLAQKAFSNYDFYPLISGYLSGTEASGLYEARLGRERMPGKEVHVFCAGYREDEFDELLKYADHIVFNSPGQLKKFGAYAKNRGISIGLRINPELSTQAGHAIYDPCAPGSRMGTTREAWNSHMTEELIAILDGLHFHTLCEQDSDDLERTLSAAEEKFGDILPRMRWLNMGGGHHITREGYDIPRLERCIKYAADKWRLNIYLEPGEAVALNAGYLLTHVLDMVKNGDTCTAIIDASAACHMPDVIEMPYRPPLYGEIPESGISESPVSGCSDNGRDRDFFCRIGGPTCLAGDIAGDYRLQQPVGEGDLLIFGDMAIYTTCKNNTFNGMKLPDIYKLDTHNKTELIKSFGYEDFEMRLGSQ